MKKIISLFQRNYDGDHLVRDEVVPGAEWVLAGEGVATRKYDGTCCMVRAGKLFKRYDENGRSPPIGFDPTEGYSVSGFGDLSYARRTTVAKADRIASQRAAALKRKRTGRR